MQLVDCDFSSSKHILSHINVHTRRHKFIRLLRIDGHVCTNEWINECDAYSLVLIHTNRIIQFGSLYKRNTVTRSEKDCGTGWGPGSPADQNPVGWSGLHQYIGEGSTECDGAIQRCHCNYSHTWQKVSARFFTICKIHSAVIMFLLLWEGLVRKSISCHLI